MQGEGDGVSIDATLKVDSTMCKDLRSAADTFLTLIRGFLISREHCFIVREV